VQFGTVRYTNICVFAWEMREREGTKKLMAKIILIKNISEFFSVQDPFLRLYVLSSFLFFYFLIVYSHIHNFFFFFKSHLAAGALSIAATTFSWFPRRAISSASKS
jgi:hypothetical protein